MDRLEEFKVLKQKYEGLRDQYFMTRNSHHFMIFQQAFKAYCSFIDQHKIAPSEIEKFVLTDVEECKKIVKKVKQDAILLKPSVRQMQSLAFQQKILDCLATRPDFFTLIEISSLSKDIRHVWYRNRILWNKITGKAIKRTFFIP